MRSLRAFSLSMILAVGCSPIEAKLYRLPPTGSTYYVSTNGSDGGPGSQAQPWQTLRQGLSSLQPGDTLIVHGGVYEEVLGEKTPVRIKQGTPDAPITVKAAEGERPVVKGLLWLARPSYWTVDGINVTWKEGCSSRSHMVRLINGVGWSFINAEVWGAKSYAGILVGNTKENEPADWRIAFCKVHDTQESNKRNQDHLIYVNTGLTAGKGLIERNILYNALNGEGVKLGGANLDEGTVNVTVRYNTIYNTAQSILIAGRSSNNRIYRNMFGKVGKNYGFVRGYQLSGDGNVAYENGGDDARLFVLNDEGFKKIEDRDNVLRIATPFESVINNLLVPQNADSGRYGRFAKE